MASVRHFERFNRRIGIVCDRIFYDSIGSAADFVYIAYGDEWRDSIVDLDVMLVVSTWRGLRGDDWRGIAHNGTPQRRRILEIIDGCRERGIPVVFYSKEDPPNYLVFIEIARRCDYVFTSAVEMVPRYIADCGHGKVSVLRFCLDPGIQNPVGCMSGEKKFGAVFSGSWMVKYPDRCLSLQLLLDGVVKSGGGLCIIDRNSWKNSVHIRFPKCFRRFVHSAVEHSELSPLHKAQDWSINVNSVTDSATMFAGRCYELLACGCMVFSNYSYGMSRYFHAIAVENSVEDVSRTMRCHDVALALIRKQIGVREVMNGNTCYDRVGDILRAVGFSDTQPARTIAVVVHSADAMTRRMFEAQTLAAKVMFTDAEFDEAAFCRFDYIARWSDARAYGAHYLEDMVNAFKFGNFDFVTESEDGYSQIESRPNPEMTVIWRGSFSYRDFISWNWHDGLKGIALPSPELTMRPAGVQPSPRKIAAVRINVGRDADLLVVRAIASLRRSKFFAHLAIELCDVDMDDSATADAAATVCAMYPGIVQLGRGLEELPLLSMAASDEALYPGFDEMIAKASSVCVGEVSGGLLLYGRDRRLVVGGVVMAQGRKGFPRRLDAPVLARYVDVDEVVGQLWRDPPIRRAPLWKRAFACYRDNGLWYTIKRIFVRKPLLARIDLA